MRVLHLTTEYPPIIYGGLGTAVGGLARASASAGIDVAVLIIGEGAIGCYGTQAPPHRGSYDTANQVAVFATPWHDAPQFALKLVNLWCPDVIHLHVFWLWGIAQHLNEQTGTPLVYTVHSLDVAEYEIGRGPPECLTQWTTQKAALSHSAVVIAPTRSEQALIARYCPEAASRTAVAGHGIDDVLPRSALAVSDQTTFLFTGRFVDRKGIRDLLEAIPIVLDENPGARFVLAGGQRDVGPEQVEAWWSPPALRRHRSQVCFTGWLSPDLMDDCYAEANVLVVPSWYEPFGMVILEAMRHGLTIAAAAVGGPAEIIDDERTGILFPPRDVKALAHALTRLANDPVLRNRLGLAAMEEIRQRWLWTEKIERFRDLYQLAADPTP